MLVNIFSTIATILSIGGNLLLSKKNKLVFPVWIISNVMWIFIIMGTSKNIPQVCMYVAYTCISIYSWNSWNAMEKKQKEQTETVDCKENE